MITRTSYGNWAHTVTLSNDAIELVATLDVGPRIIRFGTIGGPNLFKEFPDQLGGTNENEWKIRGGHRLWHAPEAKPRSYALDNAPVDCEAAGDFTLRLTPPPETENGIQKQIEIVLSPDDNVVTMTHRITNIGPWGIELAPWALTVMAPGGMAIMPLPEKRPHTEVLTPDLPLVLWSYTDFTDNRLQLGRHYITLRQDAAKGPTKIGMGQPLGWAAYLNQGMLFVKYFDYEPSMIYPDFGCNFETYTNEEMLEVESLGPLSLLEPGESVEHDETWRLVPNAPAVSSEDEIESLLRPLIEA